ncbi:MAG: chorismate lyase [Piscirickettsiaceae bacterium]|jgi:chorismate lyase|nr:chorismate lyase [Piscirickettsiaceae bacterium]
MLELTRWHRIQRRLMPRGLVPWLSDTGSLTRRLKRYNQIDFSVQVLGNSWIKPLTDESLALKLSLSELSYQREVLLMDGQNANVYARTVVPRATYMTLQQRFNRLGNKPLGEVLFTDPTVVRGPIEIACLKPGQWLYEMALLEEAERPEVLWGRRSQFYLGGKPLLVNEIFLPALSRCW